MAYIKITDGTQEAYNLGQLRRDNKATSFPKVVDASTLASYGVYSVVVADEPSFEEATQVLTQSDVATDVGGQWTYVWTVRSKTSDELAADTTSASATVRGTRTRLLVETDYLALSDSTLSSAMATYRQALRDVPTQSGFPTVTWPTKPA